MTHIIIESLYKIYQGTVETVALENFNEKFDKSEAVAIAGPSGSGKTSLLSCIGGVLKPTSGRILIDGNDITKLSDEELVDYRRDQVGLIFQFYQLFAELTAIENVSMPAEMAKVPVKEAREKAQEILEIVDLGKFANQYPDKLSGGQQQRVAIARALINEPAIIVADQLTGDLDSVTGKQIIGYLRKINKEKGTTILLVTHNKAVATQADRILTIEDGEITEEIDMKAIRSNDDAFD